MDRPAARRRRQKLVKRKPAENLADDGTDDERPDFDFENPVKENEQEGLETQTLPSRMSPSLGIGSSSRPPLPGEYSSCSESLARTIHALASIRV